MKLSIIMPTFNEEKTIKNILEKISLLNLKINKIFVEKEIIVVNDGSTDKTYEILKKNTSLYSKLIHNKKNFGKGYSFREGLKYCSGDIILIQDADEEYNPNNYLKLLKPILDYNADVVYGSRFMGDGERRMLYFKNEIANKILTFFSNVLSGINLSDIETGYKVFRSNVIKKIRLKENRFGFDPEITMKIAKKNIKIIEVGVDYYGRTYLEGKKINWTDGFLVLWCIFFYRFFS